ncbi:MAG: hypothetical protein WBL63_09750, partial [Candidatus Acidiferrum sp.]
AKGAAEAAKANAEAARLNAQAVIDAERPWMVITIHPSPGLPGNCVLRATNKGRTPAEIESGDFAFTFTSRPDDLPVPATYRDPFVVPHQIFLTQGDGFDVSPISPQSTIDNAPEMKQRTQMGNQFLFFYGRICYRGVFTKEGREHFQYETRWCYNYDVSKRQFLRSGPEEYNRFT